jgi:hypothetical protein
VGATDAALFSAELPGLDANSYVYLLPLQRHVFAVFPILATCARRPVAYTPVPGNAPPLLNTTIPRSLEM